MSIASKALVALMLLTMSGTAIADGIGNPTISLGGDSFNTGQGINNLNIGNRPHGPPPVCGTIDLSSGCAMPMLGVM